MLAFDEAVVFVEVSVLENTAIIGAA
ncbi:uncharacterized protein METZ01_LOCUS366141 [marine metagenome]|uniref:Uncharacterized protein n=1 Tax=marine metagenome TaxID=408172 RepID=A0A382SVQ2_9ZZZZ